MPDKDRLVPPEERGYSGFAFKRAVQKAAGGGGVGGIQQAVSTTLLQTADVLAGNTAKLLTVTLAVSARSLLIVTATLGVDGYSVNTNYELDMTITGPWGNLDNAESVSVTRALDANTYVLVPASFTSVVRAGSITVDVYAKALANNWHIAGTVGSGHVNAGNPENYNMVSIVAIPTT